MSYINFGPQCKTQLAVLPDGAVDFSTYFNLTVQSGQSVTDAMIAAGCDPNLAANYRKLVKKEIINCGGERSMFDFMTSAFPIGDAKPIDAKNMYFKSQCAMNYNVQASQNVSGIPGANVTFTLSRRDHSANGIFSSVRTGQRIFLKRDYSTVEIINVNTTVPYAHTVTVRPAADYAVTIVANSPMMIIPTPQVNSYSCHTASTAFPTQGHIYKMGMKIIREGWEVPLDADLHCDQLQFAKGINPMTGLQIDMWTTAAKEIKRGNMLLTKHTDLLLGTKSTDPTLVANCLDGFNGLIPTLRFGGGNVMDWDPIYGLNPRTDLSVIISLADQQKLAKEYYVTCGFEYYREIEEQFFKIIGNNPGACTFNAFMREGAVDKQYIEQYQIKSWSLLGYTFHFNVASAFTDVRTIGGSTLGNTAIFYPAQRVKDSSGNDVPPIDIYTIDTPLFSGRYQEYVRFMPNINGCTAIQGDMMEAYGAAFHCLNQWFLHAPKAAC